MRLFGPDPADQLPSSPKACLILPNVFEPLVLPLYHFGRELEGMPGLTWDVALCVLSVLLRSELHQPVFTRLDILQLKMRRNLKRLRYRLR
jgi:hypothetical protein